MDIHFSEITFSVCSFHNIITAFLITGLLWRNIEWNPRQIPEVQCTCSQLHMEIQWKEPGHEQDTWGEWSLGWEWRVLQVEHEWRTLPTGYSFVLQWWPDGGLREESIHLPFLWCRCEQKYVMVLDLVPVERHQNNIKFLFYGSGVSLLPINKENLLTQCKKV